MTSAWTQERQEGALEALESIKASMRDDPKNCNLFDELSQNIIAMLEGIPGSKEDINPSLAQLRKIHAPHCGNPAHLK